MKKIVIHQAGSFDQLKIEEHPSPRPANKEIKVKIHAVGINYADVVVRWGLYKSAKEFVGWPITPGFEFSGTVDTVGSGVENFSIGQKVFGVTFFNGYSTEICIPEHQLFHLPDNMTMDEAAGFPAVFMTAYHAMFQNIVMRSKMQTIVHSAAGGVGSALLQLCKLRDMETIGVVGSSHKVGWAKNMGANHVIDKSKEDLWSRVEEIYREGPEVIFDANGGESIKKGFALLRKGGKMISYGSHTILPKKSGRLDYTKLAWAWLTAPRFNILNMNTRSLVTFNLSFLFDREELLKEAMNDLVIWAKESKIKALPVTSYKFDDVAQAHKDLQSGQTMGKLILKMDA